MFKVTFISKTDEVSFLMAATTLYKDTENCIHIPFKNKEFSTASSQGQL